MAETNELTKRAIFICITLIFISISIVVQADNSSSSLLQFDDDGTPDDNDYDDVQLINFRDANYSTYNSTVKYKSTTLNDPKGMAPLYNITNQILDFILFKEPILDGYIEIDDNFQFKTGQKFRDHQWFDLIKHYWPILLVILLSGLIAALMPIIG